MKARPRPAHPHRGTRQLRMGEVRGERRKRRPGRSRFGQVPGRDSPRPGPGCWDIPVGRPWDPASRLSASSPPNWIRSGRSRWGRPGPRRSRCCAPGADQEAPESVVPWRGPSDRPTRSRRRPSIRRSGGRWLRAPEAGSPDGSKRGTSPGHSLRREPKARREAKRGSASPVPSEIQWTLSGRFPGAARDDRPQSESSRPAASRGRQKA